MYKGLNHTMPQHKRKHGKQGLGQWLRRWIPGIELKVKWKDNPPVAPSDYRFLTIEEVKAAKAAQSNSKSVNQSGVIAGQGVPVDAERPNLPPRERKQHSLGHQFRRFISGLGLYSSRKRLKRSRHQGEEIAPRTRHLTLQEVKAAQAEALIRNEGTDSEDSSSLPENTSRPTKSHLPIYNKRRKRSFGHKFRHFFRMITFRNFRKKNLSITKKIWNLFFWEKRKEKTPEEIYRESLLNRKDDGSLAENPGSESRHKHSSRHHHHRRKKNSRGLFGFFRKNKNKDIPVDILKMIVAEQEAKIKVPLKSYVWPVLNSTALFMIAYQVSWFVYQGAVMLVASVNHIDSVLYYYEVMFPAGNSSTRWNMMNIIFITLAGPMISLIFWAIYRFVILKRYHPGAQMRLLLVWLSLNSMMLFFGAFIGGAITQEGFGYVTNWLQMNVAIKILFSIIFVLAIILLNWKIVKSLPETAGLDTWKNDRYGFVLSRLIIPWFIGGAIMVLLKLTGQTPQHESIFYYDAINITTLLFAVVPPLFNSTTQPHLARNKRKYPRIHRSSIALWLIIAIAFVLLVRIGFSYGLHFQLNIALNIGLYHQ